MKFLRTVTIACTLSAGLFGGLGYLVKPSMTTAQEKPAPAEKKYFKGRVAPKNLDHLRKIKYAQQGHHLKRMKNILTPPSNWDSRTKNWVPPIRDQQQCGSCFPEGTPILLANGEEYPIEEVAIGDKVVSAEGNIRRVTNTFVRPYKGGMYNIFTWGNSEILATPDHPILTRRGYVKMEEVQNSDWIKVFPDYAPQGMWRNVVHIASVEFDPGYVYNLEVEEDHSYIASGIGVHNCWDFSGTGVASVAYMVAGMGSAGQVWQFSEQYTLSCGNNGGCNGDDNTTVLEWAKSKGLPTDAAYGPYTASSGRCSWTSSETLYKVTDWGFAATNGDQQGVTPAADIKAAIMQYGCVGCAVAADNSFSNYSGGVFSRTTSESIDHDVMLVGWDDSKSTTSGKTVWLMRNSWNTSWGDQGYMWIGEGVNLIGTEAVWAVVTNPSPTPVPLPPFVLPRTGANIAIPGSGWSGSLIFENGSLTKVVAPEKDSQPAPAIKP